LSHPDSGIALLLLHVGREQTLRLDIKHTARRYLLRGSYDGNPEEDRAQEAGWQANATAAEDSQSLGSTRADAQLSSRDRQ
jgi:hypothetical protein